MATTATTDVAGLIPNVISARTFDTYVSALRISPLAEENRELEGGPGDRVTLGTFGDIGEALDLAELDVIVPDKLTATTAAFTIQRLGKGVAYSYVSQRVSSVDLNQRAGAQLGNAIGRKIDRKLALNATNGRLAARTFGSTVAVAAITLADWQAMIDTFNDDERQGMVAVVTAAQLRTIVGFYGVTNAATFGSDVFIREGVTAVGQLEGVSLVVSDRLATVAGTTSGIARPILMFQPNRTLVSAFSLRPLIEVERVPAGARVEIYANALWAGGVQEPRTLTVGFFTG